MSDKFIFPNQPEYYKGFWDYVKGRSNCEDLIDAGRSNAGAYELPPVSSSKYIEAIKEKSLPRKIATHMYTRGSSDTIKCKSVHELAQWVEENGDIPIYDGIDDFSEVSLARYKLAIILRMDEEFLHDNEYHFEKYFTERLAKNFGKAEEKAFISGTGTDEPTGILAASGGADTGKTTEALSFDDVIDLYFSVDPEFRENGVWIMNDATALSMRKLKDGDGFYLWNHNSDTILGKPVYISNYMPDAEAGSKPVAFGDFSYYWMIERDPVSLLTMKEKFIANGQIGYLAYEFMDGKLIRTDAVKTIAIAEDE